MKKKRIMISAIFVSILLIGLILWGPVVSNVEHPEYSVLTSDGKVEIREYSPMIVAEVRIEGDREEAISGGFRLLADYIFGNNTPSTEIVMTAPVQQQSSEKIAMTAPVQQQASGDFWTVSFVMPSKYSMESLPKPNNQKVTLEQIPEKQYVVIRFSGLNSEENITKHKGQLTQYIETKQLQTKGSPKYAFYNPPWTFPLMRRNEIMIEINGQK